MLLRTKKCRFANDAKNYFLTSTKKTAQTTQKDNKICFKRGIYFTILVFLSGKWQVWQPSQNFWSWSRKAIEKVMVLSKKDKFLLKTFLATQKTGALTFLPKLFSLKVRQNFTSQSGKKTKINFALILDKSQLSEILKILSKITISKQSFTENVFTAT